jgi:hypothetical protein
VLVVDLVEKRQLDVLIWIVIDVEKLLVDGHQSNLFVCYFLPLSLLDLAVFVSGLWFPSSFL